MAFSIGGLLCSSLLGIGKRDVDSLQLQPAVQSTIPLGLLTPSSHTIFERSYKWSITLAHSDLSLRCIALHNTVSIEGLRMCQLSQVGIANLML